MIFNIKVFFAQCITFWPLCLSNSSYMYALEISYYAEMQYYYLNVIVTVFEYYICY